MSFDEKYSAIWLCLFVSAIVVLYFFGPLWGGVMLFVSSSIFPGLADIKKFVIRIFFGKN